MELSAFPVLGGCLSIVNSSTNPEQESAGESMFVQLFETEKDFYFAPWYGMIVIKEVWVNV